MAKEIKYKDKSREALKNGADAVAEAVKVTLGPRGRNVVIDKGYGSPSITNDGVTIAKEISLKDRFENMGAEIMKEVAGKTNDVAGDGTTTSVVLAQAIISDGMKHISSGANAMGLRLGIEKAAAEAVSALKELAKEIKSKEEIRQVASISAESAELGKIIADTIGKVGKDGVVTVEESQSFGIESEVVEGLEFDNGYVSLYMVTDAERMEAVYEDAPVLLTDKKITSIKEILPFIEKIAQTGNKNLVIIADDVEGDALTTFVVNKLRGNLNVLAIKAPGFGDKKKEQLVDLSAVLDAKVISADVGLNFDNAEISMLGKARKIISTKDKTVVIGGKGKKKEIEKRVEQLRMELERSSSKYDKEKLLERIGKLSGGVAVVRVGAATETEMKYLKLKVEDAVNATKAAIEEGVVPGGGAALVRASERIKNKKLKSPIESFQNEFDLGYGIVVEALLEPLKQIAFNAGKEDTALIVEKVKSGKDAAGYDALSDKVVADMLKAGIIDPVKVARSGVENAASAAAMLLTTEAAVADLPEKEEKNGGLSGGAGF